MKRAVVGVVALMCVAACSGGADGDARSPGMSVTTGTAADASAASTAPNPSLATTDGSRVVESPPGTSVPITTVALPDTGIPGLDSSDAFCAAWSRFGGTWQVLLVGSSFLADPVEVARWEIAASPVVASSYADLLANFPGELAAEAETVADGYFGALERRSADAAAALAATGATADQVERLATSWLSALAARDPASPDIGLEVPADLTDVVDEAAAAFRSRRTQFASDPSMVIGVDTPLTDSYLETACPDRGALTGQEIDGG